MPDVKVCSAAEITDGATRVVQIGEMELALIQEKGTLYAYRNLCPHQGGPACEGVRMRGVEEIIDEQGVYLGKRYNEDDIHIICPWHGYAFHLKDGRNVCNPALRLEKFPVHLKNEDIYVTV